MKDKINIRQCGVAVMGQTALWHCSTRRRGIVGGNI